MMQMIAFLVEHGAMLASGASVLLLLGTVATLSTRAPLHRQRIGEISVVAALVWLVLACLPLPRVALTRPTDPVNPRVGAIAVARESQFTISEIPAELIARPQKSIVTPTFETSYRKSPDVGRWIAWMFVVGAGLSVGWLILGHLVLWRLIRSAAAAPARVQAMTGGGGGGGVARVLVCGRLSRPVTCGVFRPIILLPAGLLEEECAVQLRQVLLHEMGHVEQRDGWGSLLFSLGLPALYFHPLYWWLRRSCALARELVADDRAARVDGKAAYVTHLIALARGGSRAAMSISPVGAIGILQIRSHFYRRMTMLLQRRESLATRCSTRVRAGMILVAIMMVVASACVLGVRPARAAEEPGGGGDQNTPPPQAVDQTDPNAGQSVEERMTARRRAELKAAYGLGDPNVRQSVDVRGGGDRSDTQRREVKEMLNEMTPTQVGMVDPTMRKMLDEREAIAQEMARLKAAGTGADNAKMKQLELLLDAQDEKIDKYRRDWHDLQMKTAGAGIPRPAGAANPFKGTPQQQGGVPAIGGVQLDLVNLGNSLIDASSALRMAKMKLSRLPVEQKVVSASERDEAENNLVTAEKRLRLLKGIAKVALSAAADDMNRTQKLYETGAASMQSVTEAKSKVQMLELVLQSAD
jgi:beta-lactamase regulating signal transducer with metallopeptidase domain